MDRTISRYLVSVGSLLALACGGPGGAADGGALPLDAGRDGSTPDASAPTDAGPACPEPSTHTLHVAQSASASDENDGSEARPLRTIARALELATPGARVLVHAGEYAEHLATVRDGEPCRPIVIEGERASDGGWLTVIDPSSPIASGWVASPEHGPGVYRNASLGFEPMVITIDDRPIGRITNANMASGGQGWAALARGAADTVTYTMGSVPFWDGIEALYGTDAEGVTYFRERNGTSPATLDLRGTPNGPSGRERLPVDPGFFVRHAHITFRSFSIRGAYHGIAVRGVNAHDVTIEGNRVGGGYARVDIGDRAHQVVIRGNEITSDFYGYDGFGAWRGAIDEHVYHTFKLLLGPTSSGDTGVDGGGAGDGIRVEGNEIHHGLLGVSMGGSGAGTLSVVGNHVHHMGSVGITMSESWPVVHVAGNRLEDCNIPFRIQNLNHTGTTERSIYLYRNTSWLPAGRGKHLFFHVLGLDEDGAADEVSPGEIWVYASSFTGGDHGFSPNGYVDDVGGLPRAFFVNNVFDSDLPVAPNTMQLYEGFVGGFSRNLMTGWVGPVASVAWIDSTNPSSATPMWARDAATDFMLPAGHEGIDSAIDVSAPFELAGATRAPLPDLPGVTVRGAGPDVGAIER